MTKVFDSLHERKLKSEKSNKTFTLVIGIIVAVILTFFILFSTVFYFVGVEGESMLNTLNSGDGLVVNRYATVERGDIVVVEKTAEIEEQIVLKDGKFDLSKLQYPCSQIIKVTNGYDDFEWTVKDNVLHVENSRHTTTLIYKSVYNIIKELLVLKVTLLK